MTIEKGYKQTEIGIIPEDWEVKRLGGIGLFTKGRGISRADTQSGNIPCIRYGEIYTKYNNYIKEFYSHISQKVAHGAYLLKKGDLLFACSGETKEEIGKCVAFIQNIEAYAGGDIIILSPKEQVDSLFLGFLLNSPYVVKQKSQKGQGDAIVHISAESLKRIIINIPTNISEQTAIASVLSDMDDYILSLERLIAKKKAIKQGAMQNLLRQNQDLSDFKINRIDTNKKSRKSFNQENSDSDKWEVKSVGEIAFKFLNGGTPSTDVPNYWNGNIPWITGADFENHKISNIRRFITKEAITNSSTNVVSKDNLLIVTRTGVGKMAIAPFDIAISQDITGVFFKEDINPLYIFHYFSHNSSLLTSLNQGTSIVGITRDVFEKIQIPIPSFSEQTAIAAILSDMDTEIEALQAKLQKTKLIKQGTMQQLLTGKIRLNQDLSDFKINRIDTNKKSFNLENFDSDN